MTTCGLRNVKTLLFPEPELRKFLSKKAWKFQMVLATFMMGYLVFAVIDRNSTTYFYLAITLIFRCIVLFCGRFSSKVFLAGCVACTAVDTACNIMASGEMQNTAWLPFYETLLGKEGPPCPECFPNVQGSIIFGINISFMLMFVLPFRCAAFTVPPCYAAYVTCLVYSRWNNYVQFEGMALQVKALTIRELILMSTMLFLNMVAKLIMESNEADLWYALKESQGTVLHEKILRCEAEYASECMKKVATAHEKEDIPSSFYATSVDSHHRSKSAASAPPILQSQSLVAYGEDHSALQCEYPCRGDCLQEDDVVWTSEVPHPISVKRLLKGQHVLCYDNLSKGPKHAEVLNVTIQADTVQWATITLTDGTSVRVTADHPFLTETHGTPAYAQVPVPASELKPHLSKVLVMKLVPVDVQSVELDRLEELKESSRVSIDIQQPTRHSVLVSRNNQSGLDSAVAVGASNLDFMAQEYPVGNRNTFLSIYEETPQLRRTNSSPGSLESIPRESIPRESIVKTSVVGSGSHSTSSPSSLSSTMTSVSAGECTIRIGKNIQLVEDPFSSGCEVHKIAVLDGHSRVGLRDYLYLQRSGVPSIGSLQHGKRKCGVACWFENQRQHGRTKHCSLGMLCEKCHYNHAFLKRGRRTLKL